jgi:prepilin-type N-terminal cleavage/methylation domain-containing protein
MESGLDAGSAAGGRSRVTAVRGFTLIELLIVVTIMGILVMMALPHFARSREKAYRSQMQTDLRTLVVAQESYFDLKHEYGTDIAQLEFNKTTGVTVKILDTNANSWSAEATHSSTELKCGLYMGSAEPPTGIPIPDEGIIGCTSQ